MNARRPSESESDFHGDEESSSPLRESGADRESTSARNERGMRETELAPSFASPISSGRARPGGTRYEWQPGEQLGEFEIERVLGRGGFAVVYLARQTSLDRLVALKVSSEGSAEGRHLAQFEHENIVQVYSISYDETHRVRCLCMQYVAGTTLGQLISQHEDMPSARTGADVLAQLDRCQSRDARFDPIALRDREFLQQLDFVETVCTLAIQIASGLQHAHDRQILHLDIKPNNILINAYGRPFLSDFNLSFASGRGQSGGTDGLVGGTLPYMAPEQLRVFVDRSATAWQQLDARADLYALGVVLFEWLVGELPFTHVETKQWVQHLDAMIRERETTVDDRSEAIASIDPQMARIVRRCLAPQAADRYASAHELRADAIGCRQWHRARRTLPRDYFWSWVPRTLRGRSWIILLLAGFLPHVVGSIVQIAYNGVRIVGELNPDQQAKFQWLVGSVNPLIYGVCFVAIYRRLMPIFRAWQRQQQQPLQAVLTLHDARQRLLDVPRFAAWVGGLGWLCGGVVFPTILHGWGGGLGGAVWAHFAISFLLAGSIAITYAYVLTQYAVLRFLYLEMWPETNNYVEQSAHELASVERRLSWFVLLAGVIPIAGAVLMIGVGPNEFTPRAYAAFRVLVTCLIVSGMLGARIASRAGDLVRSIVAAMGAKL